MTQVLADGTNTYLYGNARIAQYQAGMQYFGADGLGSVRQIFDASAMVVGSARYDPYGNVMSQSGTATSVFAFAGEQHDSYIKLLYLRARWYDYSTGRFTQPDPIIPDYASPQNINRYSYAFNNPMMYTDPSGLDPLDKEWEKDFRDKNGVDPTDEDRRDRLFSLMFKGSGEKGAWTDADWARYYANRDLFWNGRRDWPGAGAPSLDRFTGHLTTLSSYYKPDERDQFVQAIGLVWASIPMGCPLNAIPVALNAAQVDALRPFLFEGDAGWQPGLTDNYDVPGVRSADYNPSHHFAAFFYAGYYFGAPEAQAANWLRDSDNPEDLANGNLAASIGQGFGLGIVPINQLGAGLRNALGTTRLR